MPTDLSVDACTPARINDCTGDAWWSNLHICRRHLLVRVHLVKDWAGVAMLRYRSDLRDAPLRPTALHGRRGGGHTSSKFLAVWILNVLADTTRRMETQK